MHCAMRKNSRLVSYRVTLAAACVSPKHQSLDFLILVLFLRELSIIVLLQLVKAQSCVPVNHVAFYKQFTLFYRDAFVFECDVNATE